MSSDNAGHDYHKPFTLCGEDAIREDVIAVLWQGVTVLFFPDVVDLAQRAPDETVMQEVAALAKHAELFGMKQFIRLTSDGCAGWLEVQWCWERFDDATCASPYIPDRMEVISGTLSAWPTPFLTE